MNYSVAELASYLGVTRQLVNKHCKNGNLDRDKNGKIDIERGKNREWVNKRIKTPGHKVFGIGGRQEYAPAPVTDGDLDTLGAEVMLEDLSAEDLGKLPKATIDKFKSMEQMLKAQIERKIKRRELIDRKLVQAVFGELYTVDSNELKTLGSKVSADVAGMCDCDEPEKILRVEQRIDREVAKVLTHIKQILDTSIKSWGEDDQRS